MSAPTYHYGRAVRKCTYQILDIFNEFQIKRYDPSGNVTDTRTVPILFGPKEKLYEEMYQDANETVTVNPSEPQRSLPRMGLSFDGIKPGAILRPTFKGIPLYFLSGESPSGVWTKTYFPVPANFDYTLIMAGKYMDDLLQMYEQVFVWFHPQMTIDMPQDPLGLSMQKWDVNASQWTGPDSKGDIPGYTQTNNAIYTASINLQIIGNLWRAQDGGGNDMIYTVCANAYPYAQSAVQDMSAYEYEGLVVSAVPSAISAYSGSSAVTAQSGTGNDEDYYMALTRYTITGA